MLQSAMQKTIRFMMVVPFISIFLYGGQMTQEAFEQTLKKCEIQENGAACARLYYYFISSKHSYLAALQADKQKALYYAKKGCRLSDRDGCFSAGMTLYYGDRHAGITADRDEGRRLIKKACELGKDDVCTFFLNPNF
ncbi:MAG: hypothetical protein ABXS91_01215 [Sulfurimonas sp.]